MSGDRGVFLGGRRYKGSKAVNTEVKCSRCGSICTVDGDMPRYFAWCEVCHDYVGGFDGDEYAREVMAGIADSRPE